MDGSHRLIVERLWGDTRLSAHGFDGRVWARTFGIDVDGLLAERAGAAFRLRVPAGARLEGPETIAEGQRAVLRTDEQTLAFRVERVSQVGSNDWLYVLLVPLVIAFLYRMLNYVAPFLSLLALLLRMSSPQPLAAPSVPEPVRQVRLALAPTPPPRPVSTAERLEMLMRDEPVSKVMALPAKPHPKPRKRHAQAPAQFALIGILGGANSVDRENIAILGAIGGVGVSVFAKGADIEGGVGLGGFGLSGVGEGGGGTGLGVADQDYAARASELRELRRQAAHCFDGLDAGLEARLRWRVDADGRAAHIAVLDGDERVSDCLSAAVRAHRFNHRPRGSIVYRFTPTGD
jgi:hypothetical protein